MPAVMPSNRNSNHRPVPRSLRELKLGWSANRPHWAGSSLIPWQRIPQRRSVAAFFLVLWTACLSFPVCAVASQPIQPWAENPWYWSHHGSPVLLLGGSDDDNLFQWPADRLIPQLDRLQKAGGNVIRNTMSDRHDKGFEVYPFFQREDGKYDLDRWNETYWDRFERMLNETERRGIFVQIEVWDRFDYTDKGGENHWQLHPYRPANNINYTAEASGFAARYPAHPGQNRQPFFFTTPAQQNNTTVLQYQQKFVDRLLSYTLRHDHVLYCIDNETSGDEAWSRYWAEFIRARASQAQKRVCLTEMWDDWNLAADRHKRTFDHPELYDFVDVSQNNHNKGQQHWKNFAHVRQYLSSQPRPMNTTKTYGASGNKFGHTDQDGIERFWRHLLAGAASIRFHRPDSGLGLNDRAVNCIRAARRVEQRVRFWDLQPANHLLSERTDNEAYCAADPGTAYVVYFPKGGEATLSLGDTAGPWRARWINIDGDEAGPVSRIAAGDQVSLRPPSAQNWVVVLENAERN